MSIDLLKETLVVHWAALMVIGIIVILGAWRVVNTSLRLGKRGASAHASETAFSRFTSYLRY